jgi:hypothetical protein
MGSLAVCIVCVQRVVTRGIKEKCTQGFGAEIQRQELEDLDTDVRINTTHILTFSVRHLNAIKSTVGRRFLGIYNL